MTKPALITAEVAAALRWLSDLPFGPPLSPHEAEGRAWLERLHVSLQSIQPTGAELLDACQAIAAERGAAFPTPGQIVTVIRERRVARASAEREREGLAAARALPPPPAPAAEGGHPPPGWTKGRSMSATHDAIVDLVRRGHRGREGGEHYVVAVLREERERAEAEARGEAWRPPRYGPNLLAHGGTIGRRVGDLLGRV